MAHGGKRVGPKRKRSFDAVLLGLALGVTACVVAWGYLVKAAIDFGASARGGDAAAWGFLALASLGAVACLFIGLMLTARITRRLGITPDPSATVTPISRIEPTIQQPGTTPPRVAGGRRAAR